MGEIQKKQTISAYMASVRFMDEQVGRLIDALDRLNLRESTIVVFVSDHGYNLGEHDCWSKQSLWEGSVRVPMIISCPGTDINFGTSCESIVELIDLYPTLIELCGLTDVQPEILQGKSLVPIMLNNETIQNESLAYTVSYGGSAATIRSDRWRYTRWGEEIEKGNEELYDHLTDPKERVNLVQNPGSQEALAVMRQKLESARKKARIKIEIN